MFAYASSFNQPLGDWNVDKVTNMSGMFAYASSFNQPLADWSVDKVTTMSSMFNGASAFNQDIGDWAVDSVTSMYRMFSSASAFDQDLGWCVADEVDLFMAFSGTQGESTSWGVAQPENSGDCDVASTGNVMVTHKLRWAVTAWLADATAAEATYGHISMWETGGVKNMDCLFSAVPSQRRFNPKYRCRDHYNSAALYFNEDIVLQRRHHSMGYL